MNKHLHLLRKIVLICGLSLIFLSSNNLVAQKSNPASQGNTLLQQQISKSKTFKEFSINCNHAIDLCLNSVKNSTFLLDDQQVSVFKEDLQKINPGNRKGIIDLFSTRFNNVDKIVNAIELTGSLARQLKYEYPVLNKLSPLEIKNLMEYSFRQVAKGEPSIDNKTLFQTNNPGNAQLTTETRDDCLKRCASEYQTDVSLCDANLASALTVCASGTAAAILACLEATGPLAPYCIAAAIVGGTACSAGAVTTRLQCIRSADNQKKSCESACPACTALNVSVTTTDAQTFIVNATGGTPPYSYSLDNVTFQSSNVFSGLQTGTTYTVYVKDVSDCRGQQTFILRDPLQCNVQSGSGGQGTTFIQQILGSSPGSVTVDYEMFTIPDQMDIYYNNALVASTGTLVSGSGSLSFNYAPIAGGPYSCVIRMYAPNNGTAWEFIAYCPVNFSSGAVSQVRKKLSGINLEAANVKASNSLQATVSPPLSANRATSESLQATLSPNPSSDRATLQIKGLKGRTFIIISDMTGRELWRTSTLQDGNIAIPTSQLKVGTYMISIIDGSQRRNLKMIKTK